MKWKNEINNYLFSIGCLLSLIILIVDVLTPAGFTDYFWYISVLVFFMLTNKKKYLISWGIITTALIIIGYFLSPENPDIPDSLAISNRLISISLILILTVGMVKLINKQTELLIKVKELASTNRELESFNYISNHHMQEPLRKIQIMLSVLSENEKLSDNDKFYIDRVSKTSKQMRMLIDDLLQYSSLKNDISDFEKVNLNTIFEKVITNFKEAEGEKSVEFEIEGDCEVRIIRFQFHQLFTQLIDNSLKFSDPNRKLQISINSKSDYGNNLNPKLISNIQYCHISYIDNGIGFEPQYSNRIFNFFEQLNGQEYPGTGFGLTICKRIVENHGGIITATGELNKGARFDIYIPVDRPDGLNSDLLN